MSYFPYVKGEFYDLYAFRDTAELLARRGFTPIFEPVNDRLGGLAKTVAELNFADVTPVVVLNPEYSPDEHYQDVMSDLNKEMKSNNKYTVGLRLHNKVCPNLILNTCKKLSAHNIALIHSGFNPTNGFVKELKSLPNIRANIFILDECGRLYVKKFNSFKNNILIRDGKRFQDELSHYPASEFFSDLHVTYKDYNATGFGDYLVIGKSAERPVRNPFIFSIHLTFLDAARDNAMYVYHFLSDTDKKYFNTDSIFLNALSKLITFVDSSDSSIYETIALQMFRKLNDKEHYPGLGYIHQLTLRHHIETLANHSKIEME